MEQKTCRRVLTRRGVIWLGQTCNQRCFFCYYVSRIADPHHPEHDFMELDKARQICRVLRTYYGNTAVDIQGGEPTIYPGILDLVRFCRDLGLYPSLITNGLVLDRPGAVARYREAGLRDFLVSLHGIGKRHDEVVRVDGAYTRIEAAIEQMCESGFPFRLNCTMSRPVVPCLPDVARKAVQCGARVVNFIAHNLFSDQAMRGDISGHVARYSEIKPYLTEALDTLDAAGIEANVRYLPLCLAEPRHRKNYYNHQQLPYDTHEWDFQSWLWSSMGPQVMRSDGLLPWFCLGVGADRIHASHAIALRNISQQKPLWYGTKFMTQRMFARGEQSLRGREAVYRSHARRRAAIHCLLCHTPLCQRCAVHTICDGFHDNYVQCFGAGEAVPVQDMHPVDDPKYFIQHQAKTVEPEDAAWAL